jgi:hypothetical protein
MKFKEGPLASVLVTTGRKTGKEHAVELRAVFHDGKFYFCMSLRPRLKILDYLIDNIASTQIPCHDACH